MITYRNILLLIFIALTTSVAAQQKHSLPQHKDVTLDKEYITSYFTHSWEVLKSPVRWRGKQWGTFAAVGGLTALAYSQDDVIRDVFQRNRTQGLDQASQYVFEPLGSVMVMLPLTAAFWATGAITDNARAERVGLTSIKAMAITAVFTYAFKYGTQRHRPGDDVPPDPRIWEGPFGSWDHTSFPSGHSSLVFAVAAVFASEYREHIWVPVLSYSLATLAAGSRVYEDKHWASDVIFGSALGFFIGKFVYRATLKNPDLVIIPGTSLNGRPGFSMVWKIN